MTNLPDKTPLPGGDVYHLARTLGVNLGDLLDFSANINPLGFPPGLNGAVQEALKEIVHYPDRRSLKLGAALAAYHHLTPEEILVGNGSTELIYLAARALRPRRGLIVTPAFSEYEHALNLAQVPADFYPTDEAHYFTLSDVPELALILPASPSCRAASGRLASDPPATRPSCAPTAGWTRPLGAPVSMKPWHGVSDG